MKLTIERAALLRSLGHVQSVVERKNTIPILSNVLWDADDQGLGLTATDLDLTIVEKTAAQVEEPGTLTVPAHTLYDIVRKLPEGSDIQFSTTGEDGQIRMKSGRSSFMLSTLPKDEFPSAGDGDYPQSFRFASAELMSMIDRTRFAISTEETRYYLNGIYLHATTSNETPMLRAVATDGHRLARFQMPLPEGAEGMPGVIIPRKTVNELRKLLDEFEEEVEISLSETKIRIAFNSTVVTSKLIDGTFPDYERVIPSNNDKIMEVERKIFSAAVDRVSTISSEKGRSIKLSLEPGQVKLSATSPDNASAEEDVATSYDGPAMEIGFNYRYLLDITQQIEGEGAQFVFADGASPTIVRDVADTSALYVLMPMRV